MIEPIVWIGFIALVFILMAFDLGIFNKKAHVPTAREALATTLGWVTLALLFGVFIYYAYENKWLNLAVSWEMLLLMLIVYLPFLHEPFITFALSLTDWLIIGGLVVTVVPVLEFAKWMVRKGWFGNVE